MNNFTMNNDQMAQMVSQVLMQVMQGMNTDPATVTKKKPKATVRSGEPKWKAYINTTVEEKPARPNPERKDDLYDDGEIIVHKDFTVNVVANCSRERFAKVQRDLYAYCKAAGATWVQVSKDEMFLTFTSMEQVERLADNRKWQMDQQKLNDQRLGR